MINGHYGERDTHIASRGRAEADGEPRRLYVTFVLRREWAHYAIDFYTPAVLLVALSWVSFWLDPSQIAARVTLGIYNVPLANHDCRLSSPTKHVSSDPIALALSR